jgi:hypothetical protein
LKKFCPVSWLFLSPSSNICMIFLNLIYMKFWIMTSNCQMFQNHDSKLEYVFWLTYLE